LAAFLFGWGMLIVNPAAYAAVALIMATSLRVLVPMSDVSMRILAGASLCALMLANYRSLRFGAAIQNASTAAKALALVGLSILALIFCDGNSGALAGPVIFAPKSWAGFGTALIAVMFAYDGWQWLPQLAAEMKHPARSIPRALGGGVAIVIVIYLLANAAD